MASLEANLEAGAVLAVPGLWREHARTQGRTHGQPAGRAGSAWDPAPAGTAPFPTGTAWGHGVGTGMWGHHGHSPGTHTASRESKMTWNTNGFVPFQTKLLF